MSSNIGRVEQIYIPNVFSISTNCCKQKEDLH